MFECERLQKRVFGHDAFGVRGVIDHIIPGQAPQGRAHKAKTTRATETQLRTAGMGFLPQGCAVARMA